MYKRSYIEALNKIRFVKKCTDFSLRNYPKSIATLNVIHMLVKCSCQDAK